MKKLYKKIATLLCGIGLLAGISIAQNAKVYEVDITTSCGTSRCAMGFDLAGIIASALAWDIIDCGF